MGENRRNIFSYANNISKISIAIVHIKNFMKSLFYSSSLWTVIGSGCNKLISMIFVYIIVKSLSVQDFGTFCAFSSNQISFSVLASFGLPVIIYNLQRRHSDSRSKISRATIAAFEVLIVSNLIALLAILLLSKEISSQLYSRENLITYLPAGCIYGMSYSISLFFDAYLRSINKYRECFENQLLISIFSLLAYCCGVAKGLSGCILTLMGIGIFSSIIYLKSIDIRIFLKSKAISSSRIKRIIPIIFSRSIPIWVGTAIIPPISTISLNFLISKLPDASTIFALNGVLHYLKQIIFFIPLSLAGTAQSLLSKSHVNSDLEGNRLFSKYLKANSVIIVILAPISVAICYLLPTVLGDKYDYTWPYSIFYVLFSAIATYSIFFSRLLLAQGKFLIELYGQIIFAIPVVALFGILIYYYNSKYSFTLSYCICSVAQITFFLIYSSLVRRKII